jgi:hypothetical protein
MDGTASRCAYNGTMCAGTFYCCPRSTPVSQMGTAFGDAFRANFVGNPQAVTQSDVTCLNASAFATPAIGACAQT